MKMCGCPPAEEEECGAFNTRGKYGYTAGFVENQVCNVYEMNDFDSRVLYQR